MRKTTIPKTKDIERVDADPKKGLTTAQVQERIDKNLSNNVRKPVGKSYAEIFLHNIFNIYNLILVVISAMLIYAELYTSLLFAVIYIGNLVIGLYQDLRARALLSKLQLVTQATTLVVRDGKQKEIPVSEIVLDDIIVFKSGDQISSDAIVVDGSVGVNESMLTGESLTVYKERSAIAYAGSYVVSGTATAQVIRVGKENYINTLESKARGNKANASKLKKSLDSLFWIILLIVIPLFVLSLFANGDDFGPEGVRDTIQRIAGSVIAMVPSGLYLLASASLTVGVINLAKKRTMVQDMYSLEMLARSTTLCLDKTGTITDGSMMVNELVTLNKCKKDQIELIIANILEATHDDNATAKALKKAFSFGATEQPIYTVPFNSNNKYTFVSFRSGTYVMGAIETIDAVNKDIISRKIHTYSQQGLRVLVIGKAKDKQINNKSVKGKVDILALIILQDHIKEDAGKTIQWFQENNVKIRVISGDNAETVSQIARRVNVHDADKFISLEGMTNEEVKKIAHKYIVFGRVSPEQKEIIVESLKESGETVAMTGDGVNDILALRKADCSIAMANGADAAQNVSQLVMLDSNFASLPAVVAEGRRTINNIQRTTSLFLTKTFFAMTLTLLFTVFKFCGGMYYPFATNHLYMWEFSTIGMGAFFVALEPNAQKINKGFLSNIFKKTIPGAILMVAGVGVFFALYMLQLNGNIYTGIGDLDTFTTICTLFFAIGGLAIFYEVCAPLTLYRGFVLTGAVVVNALAITFAVCMEVFYGGNPLYEDHFNIFQMHILNLTGVNYLELTVVSIGLIAIYLLLTYIARVISQKHQLEEEKMLHDQSI